MGLGALASCVRYNFCSRLIAELFAKIFGIRVLIFFGDFGDMAPSDIANSALEGFSKFFANLGVKLKLQNANAEHGLPFDD